MINEYVVVTPAYNEEKYIIYTLDSVIKQTILPKQWIIVDDGSSDKTTEIVEEYTQKYKWIKLVRKNKEEKRSAGAKVVRAFNYGYENIDVDFEFISKLDADLTLPVNYYELLLKSFNQDKTLGLCGGYCKIKKGDRWTKERTASYHVRGAFKTYRKTAFQKINGFDQILGWDGLDQMKLMFYGWDILVLDLPVLHHRITGSESNKRELYKRLGKSVYKKDYRSFLAIVRSVAISIRKKELSCGIYFLLGYYKAFKNREEKNVSKELGKFIRKFQYKRILKFWI